MTKDARMCSDIASHNTILWMPLSTLIHRSSCYRHRAIDTSSSALTHYSRRGWVGSREAPLHVCDTANAVTYYRPIHA